MDIVREQKQYNRLQTEAKIAEAWEAGMYRKFLREAKWAERLRLDRSTARYIYRDNKI
jgi:hypothetical protein